MIETDQIFTQMIASIPYCSIVIVAIFVSSWRQAVSTHKRQMNSTFGTLVTMRGYPIPSEVIQAFNRVPIEFHQRKYAAVRTAWNACVLCFRNNQSISTQIIFVDALVLEMAKALGHSEISVSKWYRPMSDFNAAIEEENLRKSKIDANKATIEAMEAAKKLSEETGAATVKILAQVEDVRKQQETKNGASS